MSASGAARSRRPRWRRRDSDRLRPRDLVYLLGLLLVAASLWVAVRADHRSEHADQSATQAIARVQEGRATSIAVICAVESGVSDAGREVISHVAADTPFTRKLEQLGYPSLRQRQATAGRLAKRYVQSIAQRVNVELGQLGRRPPRGLIRKNGTIDCRVLGRISAVPNAR